MAQDLAKTIHIIEDDQAIREALSEFLEMEGYAIVCSSNGQDALEYLGKAKSLPNLILLDLMMPVKDGSQFRREQLADPKIKKIPVLLMSADGHAREKMGTLPVTDFLKKPLELDYLMESIQKYTNGTSE